jgi:hypothetical protein
MWNVGTCRSDAKGETQLEAPQVPEYRCGATRSSDEDSVKGLERRGSIVQLELKKTTGNGRIGLKQAKPFCIT